MTESQTNYTGTIYGYIKNQQYNDAIKLLQQQQLQYHNNRATLSLLAYCYYYSHDYESSLTIYQSLIQLFPTVYNYTLYCIQCYMKLNQYDQVKQLCQKQLNNVDDVSHHDQYTQLLLQCSIESQQYTNAQKQLQLIIDNHDNKYHMTQLYILCTQAYILYKQNKYIEAEKLYHTVLQSLGYNSLVIYNLAATLYQQNKLNDALNETIQLIQYTHNRYPELINDKTGNQANKKSIGNTLLLKQSMLIESYNLKSAIEYRMNNYVLARQTLTDMPYRIESELDPVTLSNLALYNMNESPTDGFNKLHHLLSNPPFPQYTLHNLLLLYIKYQMYDLAADTLAENIHLHSTALTTELYDYLESIVCSTTNQAESYYKLGVLGEKYKTQLKLVANQIHRSKQLGDTNSMKQLLQQYDMRLESYMPVLMSQCVIYWNMRNYSQVEQLVQDSAEYCSEHKIWKLNVGHVFFMSGTNGDINKFNDAIRYYQPIVDDAISTQTHDKYDMCTGILSIPAIVLGNLCVAYIMTNQNESAEQLMRQIESDEELTYQYWCNNNITVQSQYHLCIVNLVIGTLYCSKGNYEFGINRIIKSLDPLPKRLGIDTWYYAKRCVLSLCELCAKHMMVVTDAFHDEIIEFLTQCETYGSTVITLLETAEQKVDPTIHNVAYEARSIKRLMYMLNE